MPQQPRTAGWDGMERRWAGCTGALSSVPGPGAGKSTYVSFNQILCRHPELGSTLAGSEAEECLGCAFFSLSTPGCRC